jgi:hypothetical protein
MIVSFHSLSDSTNKIMSFNMDNRSVPLAVAERNALNSKACHFLVLFCSVKNLEVDAAISLYDAMWTVCEKIGKAWEIAKVCF